MVFCGLLWVPGFFLVSCGVDVCGPMYPSAMPRAYPVQLRTPLQLHVGIFRRERRNKVSIESVFFLLADDPCLGTHTGLRVHGRGPGVRFTVKIICNRRQRARNSSCDFILVVEASALVQCRRKKVKEEGTKAEAARTRTIHAAEARSRWTTSAR